MASLNRVMLIGNLTRDIELRYSQQGTAVGNFSIATNEKWTDKNTGERQEKTEFHRIVAWGKQAEILEKYLSKGSSVYIEGRLQTRSWEKDGQTHYTTEIVVSNFQFLGGKPDQVNRNQQGGYQQPQQNQQQAPRQQYQQNQRQQVADQVQNTFQGSQPIPDDDIPF